MTKKYTPTETTEYVEDNELQNAKSAVSDNTVIHISKLRRSILEDAGNRVNRGLKLIKKERILKMRERLVLSYFETLLSNKDQSIFKPSFASETIEKNHLGNIRFLVDAYKGQQAELTELRKFKEERLSKIKHTNEKASFGRIQKADDYAVNLQEEFTRIKNELKEEGVKYTFVEMAKRLTESNIPAPRGDKWNHNTVHRYEDRIKKLENK